MFVRVKKTPYSPRSSVQIVESSRVMGKVKQTIVKHIGVAQDKKELEELKLLDASIKRRLELENTLALFTPEEIEDQIDRAKRKIENNQYSDEDYIVNVKNLPTSPKKALHTPTYRTSLKNLGTTNHNLLKI